MPQSVCRRCRGEAWGAGTLSRGSPGSVCQLGCAGHAAEAAAHPVAVVGTGMTRLCHVPVTVILSVLLGVQA